MEEANHLLRLLQGKQCSVYIYLLDLLSPVDLPSSHPHLYLSIIDRCFTLGASPEILFLTERFGFSHSFSFEACVLKFFKNRDCQAVILLNRIPEALALLESRCQDSISLLNVSLELQPSFGKARNIAGDIKQVWISTIYSTARSIVQEATRQRLLDSIVSWNIDWVTHRISSLRYSFSWST